MSYNLKANNFDYLNNIKIFKIYCERNKIWNRRSLFLLYLT